MSARDLFPAAEGNFTRYHTEIQVVDKLIGGIPKDPDTIAKWLEARLAMGDRNIIELAQETAEQMQAATGDRPSGRDLVEGVAREFEGGNGFKTVDGMLAYEGRCMKAGLKEAANIAYPGTAFPGKPQRKDAKGGGVDAVKKGLMRYLAETVFVDELYIGLGVSEPSGTEQRIKHIMTPQGPRSAINVVDYVERPTLTCTIAVLDDFLPSEAWGRIWTILENIGLGSDRARSDGKFELVTWKRL